MHWYCTNQSIDQLWHLAVTSSSTTSFAFICRTRTDHSSIFSPLHIFSSLYHLRSQSRTHSTIFQVPATPNRASAFSHRLFPSRHLSSVNSTSPVMMPAQPQQQNPRDPRMEDQQTIYMEQAAQFLNNLLTKAKGQSLVLYTATQELLQQLIVSTAWSCLFDWLYWLDCFCLGRFFFTGWYTVVRDVYAATAN